jgi:hypothetical protein
VGKLTEENIKEIIEKYNEGMSLTAIAEMFSASRTTITNKVKEAGVYRDHSNTKQCELCGKEFKTGAYAYNIQKYCSTVCKSAVARSKMDKPKKELIIKECVNCNKSFQAKGTHYILCSDECRNQYRIKERNRRRKIKLYKYYCPECDKQGYSRYKKVYCSNKCADTSYRRKRQYKQRRLKKCVYCKKFHYKNRLCCSEQCSKKNMRLNHQILKSKRMTIARQNGQFNADIDIYKLIERDGEQCYLCGDAVSFDYHYNDPKYPTIEHVLAISNGGTHSWDNVKVACRYCNNKKGTKIINFN